jgi:hypothetical protein
MLMTDNAAQAALIRELRAGEHLLWSGMPRQGFILRTADMFLIPFSLLWASVAFLWEYSVVEMQKSPLLFPIFGIPFVLLGIYFVAGRFAVDIYLRRRTYYGLTNQRALILTGLFSTQVKAVSLQNLDEMSLTERADGSGDIIFGAVPPAYWMYKGNLPGLERNPVPAFELIEAVRTVYSLIQQTQYKK